MTTIREKEEIISKQSKLLEELRQEKDWLQENVLNINNSFLSLK